MSATPVQGIKTVLHPVSDIDEGAGRSTTALLGIDADRPMSAYYVGFDVAGQHIGLLPGGGPQGMTSPVAYWHVDDIEAKLAEVTAAGATIKDVPNEVGGGRVVATVIEPMATSLDSCRTRSSDTRWPSRTRPRRPRRKQ